jgi:hypothetical protein
LQPSAEETKARLKKAGLAKARTGDVNKPAKSKLDWQKQ